MSDRYGIKDVFLTLQGEGMRAGTKAVFLRFTGCNLWSGSPVARERGEGACAQWCDTDFFKGTVMGIDDILERLDKEWAPAEDRWVVLTGGEPCLQVNLSLLHALEEGGWRIAIETNGTVENEAVAVHADHICIAPKLGTDGKPLEIVMPRADEIKVVLPGDLPSKPGWTPAMLDALAEDRTFVQVNTRLFVQPQDPLVDPSFVEETALKRSKDVTPTIDATLEKLFQMNLQACIKQVMRDPRWALSIQTHKLIGLP